MAIAILLIISQVFIVGIVIGVNKIFKLVEGDSSSDKHE